MSISTQTRKVRFLIKFIFGTCIYVINYNRIHALIKNVILKSLNFELILVCGSYLEDKMTKKAIYDQRMSCNYIVATSVILMYVDQLTFKLEEGISTLSSLEMATQDMDIFS